MFLSWAHLKCFQSKVFNSFFYNLKCVYHWQWPTCKERGHHFDISSLARESITTGQKFSLIIIDNTIVPNNNTKKNKTKCKNIHWTSWLLQSKLGRKYFVIRAIAKMDHRNNENIRKEQIHSERIGGTGQWARVSWGGGRAFRDKQVRPGDRLYVQLQTICRHVKKENYYYYCSRSKFRWINACLVTVNFTLSQGVIVA